MVLGKAPELSETRQYLADSNLMPALEAGIAEMLKATQGEGSRQDGVNYLAQCTRALSLLQRKTIELFIISHIRSSLKIISVCAGLMRNNPRHNPEAAAKMEDLKAEQIKRMVEEAAMAAEAAAAAKPPVA